MTTATITKAAIKPFIQERLAAYQALALDIHNHPEVSNYEFYSADALIAQLEKEGFAVKKQAIAPALMPAMSVGNRVRRLPF